ncbi:MAG: glycerol-3-phosphate 1-O-acyltransferase PlsY [Burkholderiales bacterium]
MQSALVVACSYLVGSVSFAIVLSRVAGIPDPRSYGSGNPGATNVLRSGNNWVAALTLLGDGGKGWLAVLLAQLWTGQSALDGVVVPLAGVAVFLGHLFPVFHRFAGGKGAATAAGVLLAFSPWLGLATLATWIAILAFFRISSIAGLVAAVFAPFYTFWLFGLRPVFPAVLAIAVLMAWRHKDNLRRLLSGAERRVGDRASPPPPDPSGDAR